MLPHGHLRSLIRSAQHQIAAALGVDELARTDTVVAMLENNSRRAPGYWIQLTLAMGIATLGLVLGSTAVVIGAMLVSPLMGPIVELGMGFAVGSAFLVLRASLRVALSVIVVVSGAALLTLLLPFHEVTGEIAARTAPTALDLLVAVFCALTAAYTTVRAASDTTSAAAGTAIGISLVPPLCASGFGLGTGSLAIAGGAALLFTANLSAILVLAVISFLLLGYNQVDAKSVEHGYVDDGTRTDRIAVRTEKALQRAFGSRYSLAMRLLIPAVFLGAVYVPLRRALNEVTWEVRARDGIRRILGEVAPRAVQTSVTVERHTVSLHLVLIGSSELASATEQNIRRAVTSTTGVEPTVVVSAVPDAQTLAAATSRATSAAPVSDDRDRSRDAPSATDVCDRRRVADRGRGTAGGLGAGRAVARDARSRRPSHRPSLGGRGSLLLARPMVLARRHRGRRHRRCARAERRGVSPWRRNEVARHRAAHSRLGGRRGARVGLREGTDRRHAPVELQRSARHSPRSARRARRAEGGCRSSILPDGAFASQPCRASPSDSVPAPQRSADSPVRPPD